MRLLHYFSLAKFLMARWIIAQGHMSTWEFFTLLLHRDVQVGLELCPGREVVTEFGIRDVWTKLKA